MTLAQGVAAACAAGLLAALAGFVWPRLGILNGLDPFAGLAAVAAAIPPQILLSLGIGLAACLVLTPLALYFVFSEK